MSINLKDPVVLERRRPVWVAISDLCLDTEITDQTVASIACIIKGQGFSSEEATAIAFEEVFPVVAVNLIGPAGEWAGFSEEWLSAAIIKNACSFWGRLKTRLQSGVYKGMLQEDWARVLARLEE